MGHFDEIDAQRARHYAWKLPTDLNDDTEDAEAEGDEPEAAAAAPAVVAADADRAAAIAEAERLADGIDRVYEAALPVAQQVQRIESLLEAASGMGLGLFALSRHPAARIRLARLCNRHWEHLTEHARQAITGAFLFMDFDHPEAIDLLVEVAQSGHRQFGQHVSLWLALGGHELRESEWFHGTELGARLLALLDRADSLPRPDTSRLLALEFLELDLTGQAAPVLRRLLRRPHMGIRRRALSLLVEGFQPCPISAEEVTMLLEDLLEHPPDLGARSLFEEPSHYLEALHRVVVAVRPPEGAELLLQIGDAVYEDSDLYFSSCDESWVLRTIGSAYPEQAVALIDAALRSGSWNRRLGAVEAMAKLPDALARPRLLAAAADGAPAVAERARDLWLDRYASLCPVEPLAGFPVELLTAPPSARLGERLQVLRSPSPEARLAMLEVLLGEAPDREALALITFALADDGLLRARRRGVPRSCSQMAWRLYRMFGEPAIAALCWLARRYPQHGGTEWLHELDRMSQSRRVRKRDLGPLRELALQLLETWEERTRHRLWGILGRLGPPRELCLRVLAALGKPDPDSYWTVDLLKKAPRDPVLDARIVELATAAWRAGDFRRLDPILGVGLARRLPALTQLGRQVVDAWLDGTGGRRTDVEDPALPPLRLAEVCARHLIQKGKLSEQWVLDSLRSPSSAAFILAAEVQGREASPAVRKLLRQALASPARGGESAEVAALTLLRISGIAAGDPRLYAVAARAPRKIQSTLLFMLALNKAPRKRLRPLLADFLRTATREDAEELVESLNILARAVGCAAFLEDLGQIPDATVRQCLASGLHSDERDETFWQDEAEALL